MGSFEVVPQLLRESPVSEEARAAMYSGVKSEVE